MGNLLQLSALIYRASHQKVGCAGSFCYETLFDVPYHFEGLGIEILKEARVISCQQCQTTIFCEVFQRETERRKLGEILSRSLPRLSPSELRYIRLQLGYSPREMANLVWTTEEDYRARELILGGDERIRLLLQEQLIY